MCFGLSKIQQKYLNLFVTVKKKEGEVPGVLFNLQLSIFCFVCLQFELLVVPLLIGGNVLLGLQFYGVLLISLALGMHRELPVLIGEVEASQLVVEERYE
jgi:hypothetical protein